MEKLAAYRTHLCENPRLTYLFFELTDACNLACLHCGSHAGPFNKTFLPTESVLNVLDEVARSFAPESIMICLSGGEPLLHPGIFDIIARAKERGFSCGITTNGMLIDAAVAKKLVNAGVDSVTFSVDGLSDTHDWFRNRPGAYDKTLQGIRNLLEASNRSIVTQITSVIHKKNIHQLEDMFHAFCNAGVGSWRLVNLEPIGRALENAELLLDGTQLKQLLRFIREKRYAASTPIDITYGCSHYLTEDFERTVRDNYFICGSGIFVASILCNGDIYSCIDIERRPELVQGNIATDSFTDVWHNRFQAFRKDRSQDCDMCRRCTERQFCLGDAAHTWDYDACRPLICLKELFETEGE